MTNMAVRTSGALPGEHDGFRDNDGFGFPTPPRGY